MDAQSTTLNTAEFAAIARTLAAESRRLGLVSPGFRCPPRVVGVDRTLRRFSGGEIAGLVSVAVKDRPIAAVVADMIEGVVVLNGLVAVESAHVRAALWRSLQSAARDAHVA